MDRFIAMLGCVVDRDLCISEAGGVACQRDMAARVPYDENYFNKCASYEDKAIALAINAGRIALVDKYVNGGLVLDIGVGSGEFIKKRGGLTFGMDINPAAVGWLKRQGRHSESFAGFNAFTFWDVIEHVPEPENYFRRMPNGSYLFTSIPIFEDLKAIRLSKHYRPGEHLYYFTEPGFVSWMAMHGFAFLERQDFEIAAGRDSILSFAFRKVP